MEAVFAVLIVVGGIFLFYPPSLTAQNQDILKLTLPLMDNFAKDEGLRTKIVEDDNTKTDAEQSVIAWLESRIENPKIGFNVSICDIDNLNCGDVIIEDKDVYSNERVISSTNNNSNSKIVKFYFWRNY